MTYTKKILDKLPNVKFYVDIHGKLKLRLNEPINNKKFYYFRDKRKLFNLFKKFEWNIGGLELEDEVSDGLYWQSLVKVDWWGYITL